MSLIWSFNYLQRYNLCNKCCVRLKKLYIFYWLFDKMTVAQTVTTLSAHVQQNRKSHCSASSSPATRPSVNTDPAHFPNPKNIHFQFILPPTPRKSSKQLLPVPNFCLSGGPRQRTWLRHHVTYRKAAGSIPDGVIAIFHWQKSFQPH